MSQLEERLAALAEMPTAGLRQEWERAYGVPAPRLSAELLKMGVAYRLQEKLLGGLSRSSAAALKVPRAQGPTIKPGTRLVRSWNGRSISVQVTESGFLYEDKEFASLSGIAREVTGANWSGPRFFGLYEKASRG